jgi:hypothetical protein
VTATGASSASIAWNAATDNVGVASYSVYRGGALAGPTTGLTWTFTGLECERGYTLGVEAVDAAGNVSPRASVSITTGACPAHPPDTARQIYRVDRTWSCTGPVDLDLVRVTMIVADADAIHLREGCTGRIGRIEVETWTADGVKVNAQEPVAHDLTIAGGSIDCHSQTLGHQDGIQAMGGQRVTFSSLEIRCGSNPNAQLFVNAIDELGLVVPTDIVCDGCFLGPGASSTLRVNISVRSGLRNSVVCPGRNFDLYFGPPAIEPVNEGNELLPAWDWRCAL